MQVVGEILLSMKNMKFNCLLLNFSRILTVVKVVPFVDEAFIGAGP